MVFVMGGLALGLWFVAYRTKEKGLRIFFICAGLLNAVGAITALANNDPYAYKLRPDDGNYERDYRR